MDPDSAGIATSTIIGDGFLALERHWDEGGNGFWTKVGVGSEIVEDFSRARAVVISKVDDEGEEFESKVEQCGDTSGIRASVTG